MKNIREYKIVQFLMSKEFWKQVKAMSAIFFAVIFATSIILFCVTRHTSKRSVPSFSGMTINEAKDLADDYGIRVTVSDSVYNNEKLPGSVIEQEPKAGTFVKKNRRIFLVMNALNPEKIHMPNLIDVSLRQAIAILESNGLNIGKFKYVPDMATNIVLKQYYGKKEIAPGKDINKGSHIDLTLGRAGWTEPVTMPDLKGLTLIKAQRLAAQSYFNIGKVNFDNTIRTALDSIRAVVYKQKPKYSDKETYQMGSKVDIWLTSNKDQNDTKTK
jgi:beta-lactam-binding protein with PASTA domain